MPDINKPLKRLTVFPKWNGVCSNGISRVHWSIQTVSRAVTITLLDHLYWYINPRQPNNYGLFKQDYDPCQRTQVVHNWFVMNTGDIRQINKLQISYSLMVERRTCKQVPVLINIRELKTDIVMVKLKIPSEIFHRHVILMTHCVAAIHQATRCHIWYDMSSQVFWQFKVDW